MKTQMLIVTLCAVILAACGPSQAEIQATVQVSIEQTEAAKPTKTPLPTDTPVPTATATITASPTPTSDVRLIDVDPKDILFIVINTLE
jgi:hypothetical protein